MNNPEFDFDIGELNASLPDAVFEGDAFPSADIESAANGPSDLDWAVPGTDDSGPSAPDEIEFLDPIAWNTDAEDEKNLRWELVLRDQLFSPTDRESSNGTALPPPVLSLPDDLFGSVAANPPSDEPPLTTEGDFWSQAAAAAAAAPDATPASIPIAEADPTSESGPPAPSPRLPEPSRRAFSDLAGTADPITGVARQKRVRLAAAGLVTATLGAFLMLASPDRPGRLETVLPQPTTSVVSVPVQIPPRSSILAGPGQPPDPPAATTGADTEPAPLSTPAPGPQPTRPPAATVTASPPANGPTRAPAPTAVAPSGTAAPPPASSPPASSPPTSAPASNVDPASGPPESSLRERRSETATPTDTPTTPAPPPPTTPPPTLVEPDPAPPPTAPPPPTPPPTSPPPTQRPPTSVGPSPTRPCFEGTPPRPVAC